ncbi:MAG TPA: hypothetical protein VJ875_26295, partial [Pyrinomonadaceae bacterium]|nr:hypothetical protein [Pyrinomonadaceae bacterium]
MFKNSIDFTRLIHTVINRTSILSLLTLLFVGGVHTQTLPPGNKTSVAGWTPLAEQPGAPAGSYALSGFDNVNLFNGHLNFRLPLIHIGGRGSAGYTMTLPIEQHWMVQTVAAPHCDQSSCIYNPSDYRYIANPTWWTGIQPGYGPGVLQGRQTGDYLQSVQGCGSGVVFHYTLTRLTFTAPDGTEFELRDAATNGQPTTGGPPGCFEGFNRGKVFVTADGSAATFVSDTDIKDYRQPPSGAATLIYPSGYMMLRDGIRYRIVNGQVTWTRDTNGNQIRFTYSGGTLIGIDDSLNRHVSISYSDINYPSNPDVITFKGAGGATRTIKIYHALQSTVLRKHPDGSTEYTIKTFQELYPQLQNPQQGNCDLSVVSAVELPDGRQYQFRYNSYANLAQVILPTGGRFEYDWTNGTYNQGDYVWGTWERVLERRTAVDATTPIYETRMTYSIPSSGVVTVDTLDPKNGNALLARSKHYFAGPWLPSLLAKGTDYPAWQDGREYQTEEYDANGTTLLRRINHIWQQRAPVSWWTGGADGAPPNDPRLVESTTTLVDTNQVAKSSAINPIDGSVGFDLYNNQTDLWEYDYGNGVAGSLIRHTHTTFVTAGYDTLNPSSSSPNVSVTYHIRNLPSEVSVYDAAGVKRARTVFEYDNYAIDSNHNGLLARTDISGLDSAFTSSYVARGNVTGKTAYLLNTSGVEIGSISAYSQYDLAGNVVKIIDGRGYATVLDYADRFGTAADDEARSNSIPAELSSQSQTSYAFPTKVTNALGHEFYTQFDYYLGEAVNVEDANGIVSSRYCEDLLDRPTKLVVASNQSISGSPKAQTLFVYDDVNHTITRKSDQNSFADQNPLRTESLYDGLGRTIESRQYETASSFIAVQTQHDGAGRAYKVSSPFRADETILWTTTAFDALGRPISVTTPDSAVVSTSYSGNTVTVTDQAGKKRKSLTDALGRLTDVFEDPTPGLNYQTTYAYDVLDNLKTVIQGTQ